MDDFKERLLLDNQNAGEENELLQQFMKMYGGADATKEAPANLDYKVIVPDAQFCIKTKSESGEKIFLNFCTAEHIPAPKDISDNELLELLNSDDPSRFRVPMSLGEPHAEMDKSGHGCTAYDIAISPPFCDKIKSNELFMGFFMSVVMEGLDNKYELKLLREWVKLKNKRSMGSILSQNIRTQSKPWIMEVDPSTVPSSDGQTAPSNSRSLISELKEAPTVKSIEPKYRIVREPVTGHPEFLSAEIDLPEIRSGKALTLDIGEDCIMLESRSKLYRLSLYLPYNLVQNDCGAQFDKQSRRLTLTLRVVPLSTVEE